MVWVTDAENGVMSSRGHTAEASGLNDCLDVKVKGEEEDPQNFLHEVCNLSDLMQTYPVPYWHPKIWAIFLNRNRFGLYSF